MLLAALPPLHVRTRILQCSKVLCALVPSLKSKISTASGALALKPCTVCNMQKEEGFCKDLSDICNGFCVMHALCTILQRDPVFLEVSTPYFKSQI